ncbi:MAG TPA: tetratricopeptide repeat protein [Lacunisphaera sp.]|nr:tetratricopeptide repeat protein [Lacunisphaera sp.]
MSKGRTVWLAGGALVLAALAVYANSIRAPFLYDDEPSILDNASLRQLWPLSGPLTPPNEGGPAVSGRPLVNLSLAVNYAISGTQPWSYHGLNLLFHVVGGLALFGLVRRTLARPGFGARLNELALPTAFATALLWLVHPLQTEAVTFVIQRTESLMGMFFLLTLYGFARASENVGRDRLIPPEEVTDSRARAGVEPDLQGDGATVTDRRYRGWLAFAWLACLAGMFCKEVMVTAPVVVFLYDACCGAGSFGGAWRRRRWFHMALAATWLPLLWLVPGTGMRGGTFALTPGAALDYWLTQFWTVTHYLWLAFWGSPLVLEYGFTKVASVAAILPHIVVVAGLLAATAWALWRRPAAGFCGACFFLVLAPTSLVPGTLQMTVEHRMYVPLAAVIALVAGGLVARFGRGGLVVLLALAVPAGIATFARNALYRDPFALYQDSVAKWPESAIAQANLGQALFRRGDYAAAGERFRTAVRMNPAILSCRFNLALTLDKLGRDGEALAEYREAIRLQPRFFKARIEAGRILNRLGRPGEAVPLLEDAAAMMIHPAEALGLLGQAQSALRHWDKAAACFEQALAERPDDAEALSNLGAALLQLGRAAEALPRLEQAVRLDPGLAPAHFNLGQAQRALGRPDLARASYAEAVRLDPNHADAQLNLGVALATSDELDAAREHLEAAVRLAPGAAEAHVNLGNVLLEQGQLDAAARRYEAALRLRPDYFLAQLNLATTLARLGRWAEARAHAADAVRLAPADESARRLLEGLKAMP